MGVLLLLEFLTNLTGAATELVADSTEDIVASSIGYALHLFVACNGE